MKESSNGGMDFITRHSIKPIGEDLESKDYAGISDKGVELAKVRAMELKTLIEESTPNSVTFIGGASEQARTQTTAEVYGEELKRLSNPEEILVITKSDVESMKQGGGRIIDKLTDIVRENYYRKVVIDYPLVMKELSLDNDGLRDEKGEYIPYFKELLRRNNNDMNNAFKDWIETDGEIDGLLGPKPIESARNYLSALKRLRDFAGKKTENRDINIGIVGHMLHIDMMISYLAGNGKIDKKVFKDTCDSVLINETELVRINNEKIIYRGKEYKFSEIN